MDLQQIQRMELRILEDFADCCDRHQLRYYLAGGTLLGAVRHHGFIPWDDDIDVIMPRPDFEQFIETVYGGELGNYRLVDDYHKNPDANPYAKLENPNVKVKEKIYKDSRNLWIDIFPMDGMPKEDGELDRHLKKIAKYNYRLWQAQSDAQNLKNPLKRWAKKILFFYYRKRGGLYYARKMTACAKSYDFDDSEYVGCAVGKYGKKERLKKSEFEGRMLAEFEGKQFYISEGYDRYLRNLYGDYMQIPEEDKKHVHLS